MEIAVQDMPIIRRKKRPQIAGQFCFKKEKKKKRTKLAVQDMPGKGKTKKKQQKRK